MPFFGFGKKEEREKSLDLSRCAALEIDELLKEFDTKKEGLSSAEAQAHEKIYGNNTINTKKTPNAFAILFTNFKDPVTILLIILVVMEYLLGDMKATILISVMLFMSVGLRFYQEYGANKAAEKLRAMIKTKTVVLRNGVDYEVSFEHLVVGDVIKLSAGDLVPADVRIIEARELHVNQAMLTGESFPVSKTASSVSALEPLAADNLCFLGTSVENGSAIAVVIATGKSTFVGGMAKDLSLGRKDKGFEKGMKSFTYMFLRFVFVMVPLVFVLNWITKGQWFEAFLFALAVAVGLTPDMLPMIVTVNLSKGARNMSKRKVIVKHLNSIQNFGAMDVLCTDKTGTLTQGKIVLERFLDSEGKESEKVLHRAYLNSSFQTGLRDAMDDAIMKRSSKEGHEKTRDNYSKIDELPFDFVRKRLSVVLQEKKKHILICKGAVDQILAVSTTIEHKGKICKLTAKDKNHVSEMTRKLNEQGFRVLAIAYREFKGTRKDYTNDDEVNLTVVGLLAFLDPPKESAQEAIAALTQYGVDIKILTGDSEHVTKKICDDVGLVVKGILLGNDIEKMTPEQFKQAVETTTIFARLAPVHKERIIEALQNNGHIVGFMGDGINDALALQSADVGISVDTAVDIAKESSDIILLEQSLLVLKEGVVEGRRTFGNIVKYLKMATSSNFGNMFSVLGASIFLPFLPMTPLQVMTNNVLYDASQVPIPTDKIDEDYLKKPRKWDISKLEKFVLFMGPVSSLFDFITFGVLVFALGALLDAHLFQTGWFVASLVTQTLIIHVIRTDKIPFLQSRASFWLSLSSVVIVTTGIWLVYSPFGQSFGFVPLPFIFWPYLVVIVLMYGVLAHFVGKWFVRKYGI